MLYISESRFGNLPTTIMQTKCTDPMITNKSPQMCTDYPQVEDT
jgi:hypothetical protein